jgi:hypothetical protein
VPGVDGELGLADSGHTGDHHSVTTLLGLAKPVQFGGTAGESSQIPWKRVLDPDLRCCLGLSADDLERLPPLRHVPHVRM